MDDKRYIQSLINEGEHQQQDFKYRVSDAMKLAKSVSAFANTDGGRLLILIMLRVEPSLSLPFRLQINDLSALSTTKVVNVPISVLLMRTSWLHLFILLSGENLKSHKAP